MAELAKPEPIGDEVRALLRLVQNNALSQVPEEDYIDPEALTREAEQNPFTEEFKTAFDIEPVEVIFKGMPVRVHRTNNFWMIFHLYDKARQGQPGKDYNTQAIVAQTGEFKYEEIFSDFETQFPTLYKKMRQLGSRILEARTKPAVKAEVTSEEQAGWDYYRSAAYAGMAKSARKIDPNYDLHHLWG